jgi:hypothetical protein
MLDQLEGHARVWGRGSDVLSTMRGSSPISKRIRAIGRSPSGGASAFLLPGCITAVSPWNGLSPGRISSSAYCYALRPSRSITLASNSSPSRSSISARFVEAETCNQFYCSFTTKGIGRFLPAEGATPARGNVGQLEQVEEERIEVTCKKKQLSQIIQAIKAVHPYEEVVIDLYPKLVLENE